MDIVADFIRSIGALETLSIINYEIDLSVLWPDIFKHGKSLRKLAVHTPPQRQSFVWTAEVLEEVARNLPQLESLEVDITLDETECLIKSKPQSQQSAPNNLKESSAPRTEEPNILLSNASATMKSNLPKLLQPLKSTILDHLVQVPQLDTLVVNINLEDKASAFADRHT